MLRVFLVIAFLMACAPAQTLGDAARKARSEKPPRASEGKRPVYSGEGSAGISSAGSDGASTSAGPGQQGATVVCGPVSPEILEAITLRFGRELTADEEKQAEASMLRWYDANRHLERVDPSLIRSGLLLYSDKQSNKMNAQADQIIKMAKDAIAENRERTPDDRKFREWLLGLKQKFAIEPEESDEYRATVDQERRRREKNRTGQGLKDPQARRMEAATTLLGICALQSGSAWGRQIQMRVREQLIPFIDDQLGQLK